MNFGFRNKNPETQNVTPSSQPPVHTRKACTFQENGRRQKSKVCETFDHLFALLEERKGEMILRISAEQEEKLDYIRSLRTKHTEHLENTAKLVETAIQTLDESEMAVFLQVNLNASTLTGSCPKKQEINSYVTSPPTGHQTFAAEVSLSLITTWDVLLLTTGSVNKVLLYFFHVQDCGGFRRVSPG